MVAPEGPVYQAGTLSGNPLAMVAGLATLEILQERPYAVLNALTKKLTMGMEAAARETGVAVKIERAGSMFTLFFTSREVVDADGARTADTKKFAHFFRAMLGQGIYLPPSQFEAAFVSTAHSERDIEKTVEAAKRALQKIS